ncbi:NUDIX hydrolase [Marinimicrobium sp. ABcell2]|uniref:NUDIX domain-containing protein n=1 Tax=Marinimicrobium sp. ABcell2 TaxID=3069751 RepID=UPI0027B4ED1B|nr:NUDIX hydrolase [Marinimicrobium sp. ABcell2]MDQ2076132.1 NUDIX hydrolase [Marinimicrobium sp. ABcell2]
MSNKQRPDYKQTGAWQRKSSERIYDNPWIEVYHEEVITPAGTDGIYGVVHFKNTAVGVVPLDDDNNTWLVRQTRYTLNQFTWEIPEGGCPRNEDSLTAAKRELQEEVGLVAERWEKLLDLQLSNSVTDEIGVVYTARQLSPVPQTLDATEDIEVRKLPLEKAIAMVDRGEITDVISVAALLMLSRLARQ